MAKLDRPLYVAHLNHDYDEATFASVTLAGAVTRIFTEAGIGISPIRGIDQETLDALEVERDNGKWKGMALFKVDAASGNFNPMEIPLISSEELNMAVITTPSGETIHLAMGNRNGQEFAFATTSLEEMTREVIKTFELTREDVDLQEGDLPIAINQAYEVGGWKGFSVVSIDTGSAEVTTLAPEDLPFDADEMLPAAVLPELG